MNQEHADWDNYQEALRNAKPKQFNEREVWWCALGLNIGHEQNGSGKQFERPVIILKKMSHDKCYIIPLTTSQKKHTHRIPLGKINGRKSFALLAQIRISDSRRLLRQINTIDNEQFQSIRKAARKLF